MPRTVLRSATIKPVRYSAKWRRWHSLAKRSPYRAKASWTSLGNSTIPGMIACSAVQLRQSKSGAEQADFTYFDAMDGRNAKPQLGVCQTTWLDSIPRRPVQSDVQVARSSSRIGL